MAAETTILVDAEKTELREFPLPEPAPGEIVVRMVRANICGSELHIWRGHHPQITFGCVMGHEGLGRIERLGNGVDRDFAGEPLAEGDRVAMTYFQVCRRCPECQRGDFNLCRNAYEFWRKPSDEAPHLHGTMGTHYYVHRDQYVYKVPDAVPDKAAASANCALSQMTYGVDISELTEGETILFLGAGGLGVTGCALAKERGARVLVTDVQASRTELARRFGADEAIDVSELGTEEERQEAIRAAAGGELPDVVIDVTGVPVAFAEGVRAVRPGGRFISIGNISPGKFVDFDPGLFTRSGVSVHAAIRYRPWYLGRALRFVSDHPQYPWDDLLDADYSLEEVDRALRDSADRKITRASLVVDV